MYSLTRAIKSILRHQLLVIISIFLLCYQANGQQQQQQQAPVAGQERSPKIVVPNLPPDHYQFWLRNHPRAREEFERICSQLQSLQRNDKLFKLLHANLYLEDPQYLDTVDYGKHVLTKICSKVHLAPKSCWGYENNCELIYLMPECRGSSSQTRTIQQAKIAWFNQADFGYILERRKELSKFCSPDKNSNHSIKSSLECTKHFRTCRGDNLMMYFHDIPTGDSIVTNYDNKQDLITAGDVGGWNCDLQLKRIPEEGSQNGFLQSWFNELKHYNLIEDTEVTCDINFEKPAFIIKLDHPGNMYHYFCTFLNLYATLHLHNRFSHDIEIIIWDNHIPGSNFELMWTAFTQNPLRSVNEFEGKRVCFKKFVFTLLPRMVEGLYYNTPLAPGCSKTGLFSAFSKHVLHRLNIYPAYERKKVRVTILDRHTKYRRVKNDRELRKAISEKSKSYEVRIIPYESIDFRLQLKKSSETDILIGMHGAGLTNLLFLPDWAALIELHDCHDSSYSDLARLRGISYFKPKKQEKFLKKMLVKDEEEFTSLNESDLVGHDKFSNYEIQDMSEFFAVFDQAVQRVIEDREKYFQDLVESSERLESNRSAQPQHHHQQNQYRAEKIRLEMESHRDEL